MVLILWGTDVGASTCCCCWPSVSSEWKEFEEPGRESRERNRERVEAGVPRELGGGVNGAPVGV